MDPSTTIVVVGAIIWSTILLGGAGLKYALAQIGKPRAPYKSRTERMLGI